MTVSLLLILFYSDGYEDRTGKCQSGGFYAPSPEGMSPTPFCPDKPQQWQQ